MGQPTSPEVRQAIIRATEQDLEYEQIVELLGVGRATVSRTLRLHRETGDITPRPNGGGKQDASALLENLSLVGAIRIGERPPLMTHRGPVSGAVFIRFVKRYLVPSLRKGDVVILDNLNIHKMKRVRELIEEAGATAVYLPTYSSELNPIELWWNDLKRELRKQSIDREADLRRAARRERARVALSKIRNWFSHVRSEALIN